MIRYIFLICFLILTLSSHAAFAEEDAGSAGAAASDPLASVNYQDIQTRYFDIDNGNDRYVIRTEGSYMLNPNFKHAVKMICRDYFNCCYTL